MAGPDPDIGPDAPDAPGAAPHATADGAPDAYRPPPRPEPQRGSLAPVGIASDPSTARTPGAVRAPLFLHRDTYRRRRVMDAARLLPLFGTALLLLPMLWEENHSTAMGAVYLFLAWAGLILVAAVLARKLAEPLHGAAPGTPPPREP